MTKVDLPNLYQTVVGKFLIINFNNSSTSTSFELLSSHTRVTLIKFAKQEWVSESVSQGVSQWQDWQWSDSGPIKRNNWVHLIKNKKKKLRWYFRQFRQLANITQGFSIFKIMNFKEIHAFSLFMKNYLFYSLNSILHP